ELYCTGLLCPWGTAGGRSYTSSLADHFLGTFGVGISLFIRRACIVPGPGNPRPSLRGSSAAADAHPLPGRRGNGFSPAGRENGRRQQETLASLAVLIRSSTARFYIYRQSLAVGCSLPLVL